ncbi:RNA-binding transcriptional accessory protein [Alloprevotella sp. OH1205_COT-284]|uniref:Tex family protein n=1 Tax=Alloprevotella sp. OH1205_COT-284 TaxID=2491043 RepID=UPI000F5F31AC|nr:Tex family protein [Alloprevotella sp. OH1205_COT-284]RRD80579.1 RNA-binding transcriptional accessory protein [Alloprevotella sp. OH1205_COT-284]
MSIIPLIARRLSLRETQVANTVKLLNEGATIPFISRYRKEATGGLDEVQISAVADENTRLEELQHRKQYVIETIETQGKLTPELRARIEASWEATEVEDIYLPFKPKRRTRAQVAREKGLEPLAQTLLLNPMQNPHQAAEKYVSDLVSNEEEALQGARDIIAEQISEDEHTRNTLRSIFSRDAVITSKVVKSKQEEAAKYRDYFDWSEPLKRCSSHRLLAMRRGEAEGLLRVGISPSDEEKAAERVARPYVKRGTATAEQLEMAALDAYKRLLKPSIETEFANQAKERADEEAIRVFAANLKQLLLAAPLGQKRIMGIDPGLRTGCKVVCLDAQGNLLHNETIYPHAPKNEYSRSEMTLRHLADKFKVEAVAVGNGTAGRETEELVRGLGLEGVDVFSVSEDGASVYSASKIARDEFPDHDVTVRGAVSIGRRLADPLAELVKIDPKSIGVGQYQHDVDQGALKKTLDQVVESCVNSVGVNLNTASQHLLIYVSGLGTALAKNIVDYRAEHGSFPSRQALLKVPRLGAKAFEQCAGFLRIANGKNPLDNTAVHPERYALVKQMAEDAGLDIPALIASPEARAGIDLKRYCSPEVGLPTLNDIMAELDKPGRDPRGTAEVFRFDENIRTIDDLEIGMVLSGIVTNVTNFGAFVDLGIKTKGLVHVSQLSDRYVKDPATVVCLHQQVNVRVLEVDYERGRISLSMKSVKQP